MSISDWVTLAATFIGVLLGVPAGFWINRLTERRRDREMRKAVAVVVNDTLERNINALDRIVAEIQLPHPVYMRVDSISLAANAESVNQLFEPKVAALFNVVRVQIETVERNLDWALSVGFANQFSSTGLYSSIQHEVRRSSDQAKSEAKRLVVVIG